MMNREELDRPDDFNVETMRIGGDTVLLALEGQVDLHTAPELRDQLVSAIEDGAVNVVVDLSDTTFIDSMTLGVCSRRSEGDCGREAVSWSSAATRTSARSSRSPCSTESSPCTAHGRPRSSASSRPAERRCRWGNARISSRASSRRRPACHGSRAGRRVP